VETKTGVPSPPALVSDKEFSRSVSAHPTVRVRPRVLRAPASPAGGGGAAPLPRDASEPTSVRGETGIYLRRSWALVERMRAAVAARRGGMA